MGFIYSFVTLDDDQLQCRRQLLDFYASVAQFSALIPLFALYLSYHVPSLSKKLSSSWPSQQQKERQSPRVSRFSSPKSSPWAVRWRRLNWYLGDDIVEGWYGWGTKREWAVAGVWTLWLLVLAFSSTGDGTLNYYSKIFVSASFVYLASVSVFHTSSILSKVIKSIKERIIGCRYGPPFLNLFLCTPIATIPLSRIPE